MSHFPPHQQRVVDEQIQLAERIQKLTAFVSVTGGIFASLDDAEKARLHRQLIAMETYDQVLLERIAAFKVAR